MIGHALIMMIIAAITVDHKRDLNFMNAMRQNVVLLPASLSGFITVFALSYWGLHAGIYGLGIGGNARVPQSTHTQDKEHPHPTEERYWGGWRGRL